MRPDREPLARRDCGERPYPAARLHPRVLPRRRGAREFPRPGMTGQKHAAAAEAVNVTSAFVIALGGKARRRSRGGRGDRRGKPREAIALAFEMSRAGLEPVPALARQEVSGSKLSDRPTSLASVRSIRHAHGEAMVEIGPARHCTDRSRGADHLKGRDRRGPLARCARVFTRKGEP